MQLKVFASEIIRVYKINSGQTNKYINTIEILVETVKISISFCLCCGKNCRK